MGIIRTMGKFCYVECDLPNCNKKMEHIDEKVLKELAKLCGWMNRGNQWMCPECAERNKPKRKKPTKSSKKTGSSLKVKV
jgi:hypothetical protein